MYAFNLVLTAGAGLLTISILRRFGFSALAAALFVAAAMCSPNIFYFESYIFYPHFTYFLVTLLVWLLVQVRRDGAVWPVAAALGVLAMLSWTWAIFHPVFVGVAGVALVVVHAGWTWKRAQRSVVALAGLAFCASLLPTVKNFVVHGTPSASTWMGLNLAQTIPGGQAGAFLQCDFETAQRNAAAARPDVQGGATLLTQVEKRPGAPNMNHIGMIATSKVCFDMTKQVILENPFGWIASRIQVLAGTHQLAPSDYNADPLGWQDLFGPVEQAWASLGAFGRSAMTLWYLVLVWFAAKKIRSGPALYVYLLGFIAYLTLASHFLNGGEQARMRYTLEPIYLFLSAGLMLALWRRLSERVARRRVGDAALAMADSPPADSR
jgi:hypothetical protein